MFTHQEKQIILQKYNTVIDRIKSKHIGTFKNHVNPVFLISDKYPGTWLEHVYDSVFIATLDKNYIDIAKNTINLFVDNQKPTGQLPCYVIDLNKGIGWNEFGYGQIQECVSFVSLCLDFYNLSGDKEFLAKTFEAGQRWIAWLEKYRMPRSMGLIETFCGFDTGHDHSSRLDGSLYVGGCKDKNAENYPENDNVMPMISPDMNAVHYGNLSALSKMAQILGNEEKCKLYAQKAEEIKNRLYEVCYDKDDKFFYDVDKNNQMIRVRSISASNVLCEHIPDKAGADEIYYAHFKNPDEFYTPFPFPSIAANDKTFEQRYDGNSWGFYSQALTILRCTRWMDFYGYSADFDEILEKWVRQWTFHADINFGQELHPITGKSSKSSEWYSSCMLVYIYAVKRLGLLN